MDYFTSSNLLIKQNTMLLSLKRQCNVAQRHQVCSCLNKINMKLKGKHCSLLNSVVTLISWSNYHVTSEFLLQPRYIHYQAKMIEVDEQINLWVSIQIFSWVSLKPDYIWYCTTVHSDLSSKFTPACQPVRCNTKANHNLVTLFFSASKSMIFAGGLQILKIGEKMPEINSDFNRI